MARNTNCAPSVAIWNEKSPPIDTAVAAGITWFSKFVALFSPEMMMLDLLQGQEESSTIKESAFTVLCSPGLSSNSIISATDPPGPVKKVRFAKRALSQEATSGSL